MSGTLKGPSLRFSLMTILAGLMLALGASAQAADCDYSNSWLADGCAHVAKVWNEGRDDVYLSGWVWHNRSKYDQDKIDSYNEFAYGGGYGRSIDLEGGGEAMLYGIAFADSHEKPEIHAGYARLWYWGDRSGVRAGLGWTGGLFSRSDIAGGVPLPYVLPLAAVQWQQTTLMATYVPGGHNNGNVLYVFGRFSL